MSDPRIVTVNELKPVLDILTNLQWPIPFSETPHIIKQLGWEMLGELSARSTLPISNRVVLLGNLNNELSRIDYRLSDTVAPNDMSGQAKLRDSFELITQIVSDCLGFGPTDQLWACPGVKWHLLTDGQINLPSGLSSYKMEVWSKELADVERFEISHGVDPEHNLEDWD